MVHPANATHGTYNLVGDNYPPCPPTSPALLLNPHPSSLPLSSLQELREQQYQAEEEEYRRQLMAKFAEEDRIEQMNAQKRRMRVSEPLRLGGRAGKGEEGRAETGQ